MKSNRLQQIKDFSSSNREESRYIEYSISLLEKALGFVKVFGLTDIPEGVKNVLDYALKIGDCTQEQIELSQIRYYEEYEKDPLEKIFS